MCTKKIRCYLSSVSAFWLLLLISNLSHAESHDVVKRTFKNVEQQKIALSSLEVMEYITYFDSVLNVDRYSKPNLTVNTDKQINSDGFSKVITMGKNKVGLNRSADNSIVINDKGHIEYLAITPRSQSDIDHLVHLKYLKGLVIRSIAPNFTSLSLPPLPKLEELVIDIKRLNEVTFSDTANVLRTLRLHNQIKTAKGLHYLKNLQYFASDYTNIEDFSALDSFSRMKKLIILTDLLDVRMPNLTKLTKLTELNIRSAEKQNIVGLRHCKELESAVLSMIDSENVIFPKSLKALSVVSNEDDSGYFKKFSQLTKLEKLTLVDIGFTSLVEIKDLKELQKLAVVNSKLNSLKGVENFSHLKELKIVASNINKIEYVNQLDDLEKLYLDYNKISRIEGFSNLSKLQEVTLNYNPLTELSRDEFEKMKLNLFRGNIFVEQTPFFKAIEKTDPELFEEISSTYYPIFD